MADTKISALSSGAPAQAGDEYVVARSGSNYKLTLTNIAASMPPIGATTPNTGAFTTLSASSTVSGTGFSTYLASPPAIGSTAANTGAFTTLTTSSTVTLNGGTANGVLYLNASKVATSGSAFTFSTLASAVGAEIYQNANLLSFLRIANDSTGAAGDARLYLQNSANTIEFGLPSTGFTTSGLKVANTAYLYFDGANGFNIGATNAAGLLKFYTGGTTERMRIDSSGNVGIGTTSPAYPLTLGNNKRFGALNTSAAGVNFAIIDGSNNLTFGDDSANTNTATFQSRGGTIFNVNLSERMRIDTSGNVLVGGTAARGTTVGTAHIDIFNGTAPAGTLTNGVSLYSSSGDLNFMNSAGNGFKVGYRNLPPVGTQTGSYTLAAGDVGKYVQVSTGGSITIPTSVFAEGDAVSIYNNTTGNITITCSAPTAYIAGTNTVKTSMTLATRGVATVLFYSATACVVSGNVS